MSALDPARYLYLGFIKYMGTVLYHWVDSSLEHISVFCRRVVDEAFDEVYLVDVLDSRDVANLSLLERPDLGVTFTKLHCWRLDKYKKCVFLDADTLVSL